MASASRPHPFGLLPTQVRTRIYNFLIPERLQFVKVGASREEVQPSDLIPSFKELMQQFPHLAREMRLRLFSQPRFEFVSSERSGQYSHGCQLALEFLKSILSADIGYIRKIHLDLEWTTKAECADTFFQMLGRLAQDPIRDIKDLDFEVQPVPEIKRPNRDVSTPFVALTLNGLLGLEIIIFVSVKGPLPDPVALVSQINGWLQHRRDASSKVNFLEKLPLELRVMVYRYLPIPLRHVIGPHHAAMPTSCLSLIQVNRRMNEELIPILYGDCVFELRATESWRHVRNENPSVSDRARWISAFLCNVHATLIKRFKIVLQIYEPRAKCHTPPINTIITKLRRHCKFQIHDTYAARATRDVPITSNEWNSGMGKRCFQIKLVTQRGIDLVVEIQAHWDNQTQAGLVKNLQERVARRVYSRSVNGRRSKVDNNFNVLNA